VGQFHRNGTAFSYDETGIGMIACSNAVQMPDDAAEDAGRIDETGNLAGATRERLSRISALPLHFARNDG